MRRALGIALAVLFLLAAPLDAQEGVALDGKPIQGGLVFGKAPPGTRLTLDGAAVATAPDGAFLLGFGRDQSRFAALEAVLPNGLVWRRSLEVEQRRYDVQRVSGLPQATVTPDEATAKRIAAERERVVAARSRTTAESHFASGFAWPATGPVSGIFGSQRILNGEPRAPHNGVDVAAPVGTKVGAMAGGIVTLAEQDMVLNGKTVLIDHGLGLSSVYLHLSEVSVVPGERVAKGQAIGRIGGTGRVTAPHLHWGVNWNQVALDPAFLVGPMPSAQ